MRNCRSVGFPSVALMPFSREVRDIFNGLLDDTCISDNKSLATYVPSFNLEHSPEALTVTADLPGVSEKEIDVQVVDGNLIVSGERSKDYEEKKENHYYIERNYGSFKRSVALGKDYDADKISASLNNGVLKISIPKRTDLNQNNAKKIEINTSK